MVTAGESKKAATRAANVAVLGIVGIRAGGKSRHPLQLDSANRYLGYARRRAGRTAVIHE